MVQAQSHLLEAREVLRSSICFSHSALQVIPLRGKNEMAKPKFTYFVKKAVQDFAKANKMMVGSDAYDAINVQIDEMMKEAAKRCKENKRKTLKAYDF